MRAQLDASGGLSDGCVDIGDMAEATASEMAERGYDVDVIRLPNQDGATESLEGVAVADFGSSDLAALVSTILADTP